ncbi:MAG: preprotein translocase subunit SecA [Alphaproteobacteria bacterium]
MLKTLSKRIVGNANERFLRRLASDVEAIGALEDDIRALSDDEIRAKFSDLQAQAQKGASPDSLLAPCFALVREAAWRSLGQRHFDVQLMGGMVLHRGMIAEMRTGEGKTLAATLAVVLNALSGKGTHVVTVNDYLASRDSEWMGEIYHFLGLSVGCIVPGMDDAERRAAYATDITYSTNSEIGFDYLRDNMKYRVEDKVQRPFNFAVIDEVDSILIDEARTPLIISGPTEASSELYVEVSRIVHTVKPEHYEKDEKRRSVTLTEEGVEHFENKLRERNLLQDGGGLYELNNVSLLHYVEQSLRAYTLFERDVHYLIKDNQVFIVDEFTGRMMEGRRFGEGLHQALEAKENVTVQRENQTLATITYQNFFRLYPKLAGMTGTAMTEAAEFADIYGLEVIEIPTHLPVCREDSDDEVYRNIQEKEQAVLEQLSECQERGQPVLVGTVSIERSEQLSKFLKGEKIAHEVLNARSHEREAYIIAQAGVPGAVTIATNMAGRGTDIQLGGNAEMRISQEIDPAIPQDQRLKMEEKIRAEVSENHQTVIKAGGLFVLGTERHESRRIDNQLRGRSGRQGDPGASRFFLSLEDDLLRIFASERLESVLKRLGLPEGEAIIHPWVSKALEKAQQKVEARNFEIRKTLLKYDDVMNEQRKIVYQQRHDVMESSDLSDTITDFQTNLYQEVRTRLLPEGNDKEEWNLDGLHEEARRLFNLDLPVHDWEKEGASPEVFVERLTEQHEALMRGKEEKFTPKLMRQVEQQIILNVVDRQWKDHLLQLDGLRHGIGLRAYGQRDPLNEFKSEAFSLFSSMLERIREQVVFLLSHVELRTETPPPPPPIFGAASGRPPPPLPEGAAATTGQTGNQESWGKVARNAPCPCGSGLKYKRCHGRLA